MIFFYDLFIYLLAQLYVGTVQQLAGEKLLYFNVKHNGFWREAARSLSWSSPRDFQTFSVAPPFGKKSTDPNLLF